MIISIEKTKELHELSMHSRDFDGVHEDVAIIFDLAKWALLVQEKLEDINDSTASILDNMQHYFDNQCCPTVEEVNAAANLDSLIRYLRARLPAGMRGSDETRT